MKESRIGWVTLEVVALVALNAISCASSSATHPPSAVDSAAAGRKGSIGGAPPPQAPQSTPTLFGALHKESGNDPPFPESLRHGNMVYVVETKICVSTTGDVDTVTLTKPSDTLLDASVLDTVRTWRYRPMTIKNTPAPLCYPARFEFRSTAPPQAPQSMSRLFGTLQKESGNDPPFPESLRHGNMVYAVETKICVSPTGDVDTVSLTKPSDTLLDASVLNTVKTWRYRPMTINDMPVAFCYPARFEFQSGR